MSENFIVNDRPATDLRTADFYYHLPEELIAQHPMEKRFSILLCICPRCKLPSLSLYMSPDTQGMSHLTHRR